MLCSRQERECLWHLRLSGHVNLAFFRGVELKDPEGLLEGTGRSMRHIKLRHVSEVNAKVIVGYIQRAGALAAKQRG